MVPWPVLVVLLAVLPMVGLALVMAAEQQLVKAGKWLANLLQAIWP